MWLITGVALIILMPNARQPREGGVLAGLFLIAVLLFGYGKSKRGMTSMEQEQAALSISQDPYRIQLERKRDGLLHWAAGGQFNWTGAGATFVFFLIGLGLFPLLLRWIAGLPLPASIIFTNVALTVFGVIILSMFWAVVRMRSLRAARAIQDVLDAIDKAAGKQ